MTVEEKKTPSRSSKGYKTPTSVSKSNTRVSRSAKKSEADSKIEDDKQEDT